MPNLIDLLIRLSQIRGGHCFVDFSIFERDEGKGCNFENKMYCKLTPAAFGKIPYTDQKSGLPTHSEI